MFAILFWMCYNGNGGRDMLKQDKLLNVLDYINRYIEENGFPPTVRDKEMAMMLLDDLNTLAGEPA